MSERGAMLPPGPKSAFLEMVRYARNPEEAVFESARRFGDPFTAPTFFGPIVVTSSPEAIRTIFSADSDTLAPFAIEPMVPILGRGSLLLQYGAPHRRARRLMQPPFHGARMRAYGEAMREVAGARMAASPIDRAFPIEKTLREISIEIICRTVFGAAAGDRIERYRRGTLEALGSFNPMLSVFPFLRREFGGIGPWAKFRRSLAALHDMLREEIRAREEKGLGEDILSLLVAARDEDGSRMEEQEIIEQLFTLVIAGYETTATALAWMIDEVHRAPGLVDRLKEELRATAGDPDLLATHPLLEAVVTETLRLHPLAPMVSRRLLQPFEICDRTLPAGTGVAACLLLTQRNPDRFPDPDKFDLDRPKASPFEYFPFGGGVKRCLGAAFAMHEMKIVLGTIILEHELSLASSDRPRPEPRQATVGPKGGVPVVRRASMSSAAA